MVEIKVEVTGPGADALKELASGGRGALKRAFGPALTEFGEMLGDRMKLWRFTNFLKIWEKAERLIAERNLPDGLLKALPYGDAMRTLEAASQEDEGDVQELWARLIVNAATASGKPSINKLHVEILRALSPADASLLQLLYPAIGERTFHGQEEVKAFNTEMNAKADAVWRRLSEDERGVSVQNLIRLRCITATPRMFNAENLLKQFSDRQRRVNGALVDPRRFEEVLSKLVTLIYQAAGALPYDATSPLPLHYKGAFGPGHGLFGQITVPELNHMLTPLGLEFMKAVTLDRAGKSDDAPEA